ncbi:hypothetical protein GQF03_17730 [Sneathiella chungangensis]|uniref:Uncharacterized protein n=1 Tax=Sneathiella chungangensis TaxID=1418234 RepID=A0A845MK56_9PROT|nr:hypothetical protein [Sneathiella chungangensis]MZR24179.1 hypothetical protein [Sneathiella chungangensis]
MTTVHAYPVRIILGGYARAGFGIALTLVPLLLLNPISVIVYLLVFLLCVFVGFGVRAVIRQFTRFEVSGTGIVMSGPVNRRINWEELEGFSLNYYSTRRDREAGWMQLKLKGGGARLGIDSTISDFEGLVRLSFGAAARNGLMPDAKTVRNLQALGISRPESGRSAAYGTVNR